MDHQDYGEEPPIKLEEPILEKRRYTDVLCLPLFLGYLAGMFLVGVVSFKQGDINRIEYMLDRTGNLCGSKNGFKNGTNGPDFTHQKFVYWLDPYDFIVDADISTFKSVCVGNCPKDIGASVCEYDRDYLTNYNLPLASAESTSVGVFKFKGAAIGQGLVNKFKDAPPGLNFTAITGRYSFQWYGNAMAGVCVILLILTIVILRGLKRWIEVAVRCMEICGEAIDAIQPIQVTQAVVYTQRNAPPQTNFPNDTSKLDQPQPMQIPSPQTAYQAGREIQTPQFMTQVVQPIKPGPIDLIWERLQAPFLRPLLLITLPILCVTMGCWLAVLLFIISICTIQQQSNGAFSFMWTWKFYILVIYHSFGLVWAWQMINGFNDTVIAGSISYYYWHRYTVFAPVGQVLVTTLRYNCGSAIFGGLFFAPALLVLRNVCNYIDKILQCFQQCGRKVPQRITCSVDQSLSCIDNIISYFNKHALIFVAIKGRDYCASACLARDRLRANAALMSTLSVSPDGLLSVGKILVCFTCAICALGMSQMSMYSDISSEIYISSPIFLTFMTTIISYAIAHTLMQVYKTTWDTLILNLCEDCERYHGRPRFCPPSLMEVVQKAMELKVTAQKQQQENAMQATKLDENDDSDD